MAGTFPVRHAAVQMRALNSSRFVDRLMAADGNKPQYSEFSDESTGSRGGPVLARVDGAAAPMTPDPASPDEAVKSPTATGEEETPRSMHCAAAAPAAFRFAH